MLQVSAVPHASVRGRTEGTAGARGTGRANTPRNPTVDRTHIDICLSIYIYNHRTRPTSRRVALRKCHGDAAGNYSEQETRIPHIAVQRTAHRLAASAHHQHTHTSRSESKRAHKRAALHPAHSRRADPAKPDSLFIYLAIASAITSSTLIPQIHIVRLDSVQSCARRGRIGPQVISLSVGRAEAGK